MLGILFSILMLLQSFLTYAQKQWESAPTSDPGSALGPIPSLPQSSILKDFLKQWKRALVHPSEKLRHLESKVWQRAVSKAHWESQRFPQGATKPFSGEV